MPVISRNSMQYKLCIPWLSYIVRHIIYMAVTVQDLLLSGSITVDKLPPSCLASPGNKQNKWWNAFLLRVGIVVYRGRTN